MLYIIYTLLNNLGIRTIKTELETKDDIKFNYKNLEKKSNQKWIINLFPLFIVTLFSNAGKINTKN